MIGVAWGTSLFRAWRFGADGTIRDRRSTPRGLRSVPDLRFADTMREELGRWIAGGEDRILVCGPVVAWRAAPPVRCPCGVAELAAGLQPVPFDWASVRLVPSIRHEDPDGGIAETMAGEETHLLGAAAAIGGNGVLCMPGPLSCWARVVDGRVATLSTFLTGEAFAALRGSLLGRISRDAQVIGAPAATAAFDEGVARARDAGGLLRQLASLRAEAARPDAASCLFGLLIGHELRAALTLHEEVHLVGPTETCALYARAIRASGGTALPPASDHVAAGLALIGAAADWS